MLNKTIKTEIHKQLGKYGKVSEEEDRFIVFISQRKVYKNINKGFNCTSISDDIMKELGINKSVYYIFDNIIFDERASINAPNANLIFKNCKFYSAFKVSNADSVTLENNEYIFYETATMKNNLEFVSNKLSIRNNNFTNTAFSKKFQEPPVNIDLIGKEISIENSNICTEYSGYINIIADKLYLKSSAINGPNIYLSGNDINASKSIISATESVEIDNKSCSFSSAVKAPVVIYNGIKLRHKKQILEIDKEKETLILARCSLINKLQDIKDNCVKVNDENLLEVQKRLNNKKICKVLKK